MPDIPTPGPAGHDSEQLLLARPASRFERWLHKLAMIGVGALCIVVTLTVVSRWFGKSLIPDDVLIVRELMVAVILLPLALVTAQRAHISVTVFTERLSARNRIGLDRLGHGVGLLFVFALLWAGSRLLLGAWQSGEYFDGELYIPMWIGYAVYVLGLAIFAVRLAVMLYRVPIATHAEPATTEHAN